MKAPCPNRQLPLPKRWTLKDNMYIMTIVCFALGGYSLGFMRADGYYNDMKMMEIERDSAVAQKDTAVLMRNDLDRRFTDYRSYVTKNMRYATFAEIKEKSEKDRISEIIRDDSGLRRAFFSRPFGSTFNRNRVFIQRSPVFIRSNIIPSSSFPSSSFSRGYRRGLGAF